VILDIPKLEVESKTINQSSKSLHRSKAAHVSMQPMQVLISLPNCRHVLIDCLICNLLANIVNRLHYCTVYKVYVLRGLFHLIDIK